MSEQRYLYMVFMLNEHRTVCGIDAEGYEELVYIKTERPVGFFSFPFNLTEEVYTGEELADLAKTKAPAMLNYRGRLSDFLYEEIYFFYPFDFKVL